MRSLLHVLVLIATTNHAHTLEEEDVETAKEFLFDYGYSNRVSPSSSTFESALSLFRSDFGISSAGRLGDDDMRIIKSTKCGTPARPGQQIRLYSYNSKMIEKPFLLEEKHLAYPTKEEIKKMRKYAEDKLLKDLVEENVLTKNKKTENRATIWRGNETVSEPRILSSYQTIWIEKSTTNTGYNFGMETPRIKRQVLHGHDHSDFQCYGTSKRPMTWCIENCLHNFCNITGMRKALQKAFDWWSSKINLNFEEFQSAEKLEFWDNDCFDSNGCTSADFVFAFDMIDGPSAIMALACPQGTLIHNKCPRVGYIIVDATEGNCPDESSRWKLETNSCSDSCGYSYLDVMTHEIGHVLGIEHETGARCGYSIMNPIYKCVDEDVEMDECVKDQLLNCYDFAICKRDTGYRVTPNVTWCLANCLCNNGIGGFCNIQGMREEINKAMQWWATRSGSVISEICCDNRHGAFWKYDCNQIQTCLAADIVISFNKALDGPGSELVRYCAYGSALNSSIGCTQPGIIFFDSTEGICPDGSSRWKLRTDNCNTTSCPGSISFYHQLVGAIGRIAGFQDVENEANCTSSVMNPNITCRTGQPILDSCLKFQIETRGGMKPFPEI